MTWLQTLIVALATLVVTKFVDLVISFYSEKREFRRFRRESAFREIDELKNEVGKLVELSLNWKAFDQKQKTYIQKLENDHEIIGRYKKYTTVANAARDTIHWCSIVASCEMKGSDDLIKNKNELENKFQNFLQVCDKFLDKL